jgi:meso-butanediol dehydrogenase / (S,S)-butanediol dehydrogenase / diacetyl reductase
MPGRLEGKVAVITGAGDGMARQVALKFAGEGASIVGCDIDEQKAADTVKAVRDAGGQMESLYPLDLREEDNAHKLAEFAAEKFGGIDIVYNNAMEMKLGVVEDIPLDHWQYTMDNTLTIHYLVAKHTIPHLRKRGGGAMVFVASVTGMHIGSGYQGNLGFLAPYACAKAGILRLTDILANELSEINVRVNSISPGYIGTPNGINFYGQPGTEERRVAEHGALIRRLGEGEDIADAALFLVSDDARWVTGHNLVVDGGYAVSGGFGPATDRDKAAMAPLLEQSYVEVDHWPTSGERAS